MPLPIFSYFQKVTAEMFGEMPVGKNEDDGSIFSVFLKESRLPVHLRSKSWEDVRDILQKYRVRHVFFPARNQHLNSIAVHPIQYEGSMTVHPDFLCVHASTSL